MLEYPNKVRKYLTTLGFNVKKSPYSVKVWGRLFMCLSVYFSIQAVNSMIKYWDNMSVRFVSIEHIIVTMVITCGVSEFVVHPVNIEIPLRISEEDCFTYNEMFVEQREKIVNDSRNDINISAKLVYRFLLVEFLALVFSPLIHVGSVVLSSYYGGSRNMSDIFDISGVPLPLSTSSEHKTILAYAILYVLQVVYLYGGITSAYCFNNLPTFAIQKTTTELIFFNAALKCYDKLICEFDNVFSDINKEHKLKIAFREVVMHHSFIYRKCRLLTESLGMILTIINNGLTFLICVDIYSFVQATDTVLKFKYMGQILPCVGYLYLYSLKGQALIDANETIYQSIAELSWIGKPKWFKTCILLMLTRNKRRAEVKPFGLYVVDVRNFAVVMNGAYSYFNLLNRIS